MAALGVTILLRPAPPALGRPHPQPGHAARAEHRISTRPPPEPHTAHTGPPLTDSRTEYQPNINGGTPTRSAQPATAPAWPPAAPGRPWGTRRFNVKGWLLWTAGFVSFPLAGIAAQATVGRIKMRSRAGRGLVAGAVIGPGQWLVARRLLGDPLAWIAATAAAMGIGLLAGASVVGYGTSVGELALMGAITGLPVGAVQGFLLRDRVARSWVWAVAMPLLWALGWTVTAAAGIDVDRQYAVFGAFGAITFMALSGVVLDRLRAATPAAPSPQHGPPAATA